MKSIVTVEHKISGHTADECDDCRMWEMSRAGRGKVFFCLLFGELLATSLNPMRNYNIKRHPKCKETAREVKE